MEYRNFDKLNIQTSLLGFGCMRFPTLTSGKIDRVLSTKMLDRAYEAGVNYYDTAYIYHEGESEEFIGSYLNKHKRDSYYLADKLPCWLVRSLEDAQRIFQEQLERLDKEYIDFYLLHSLSKTTWQTMLKLGVIDFCESLRAAGKIRYLGFSFHDEYEVYDEIIHHKDWDFCQIQLNYMDTDYQAGLKGYEVATALNIPVIVMEPVKGGSLATLPEEVVKPLSDLDASASLASWALRWAGSFANVKLILSGMTAMEQVEDNLKTLSDFRALEEEERQGIEVVKTTISSRVNNGCTGCNYCMPCPVGVNIPQNFKLWNTYGMYQNQAWMKTAWKYDIKKNEKAKHCVDCGKCEEHCPQQISIRQDLKTLQLEIDTLVRGQK